MAFLNDITLGQYFPGDSVVHGLDPRAKFVAILFLMSATLFSKSFLFYLVMMALIGGVIWLSRLPFWYVLRNVRPFLFLILLTFVFHACSLHPLRVTAPGMVEGALFGLRLAILILVASLLTLTTSPIDLTDGLERLMTPLRRIRVPVHELAMMMVIALRFIPLLIEEADRLRMAQISRGASFEGGWIRKTRSLIPLLVPLFLSAFRKADQLALAMEARSYRGGEGRTSFARLKLRGKDRVALGLVGLACGIGWAL
ncbi:MAG: energy-coupling factor transporter transmembrane component T [Candidatus Latescibacterota bacterium]